MCLKGKEWSPLEGCLEAGDHSSQAPSELTHHWSLGQAPHIKEALGFSLCGSLARLRSQLQSGCHPCPKLAGLVGNKYRGVLNHSPANWVLSIICFY